MAEPRPKRTGRRARRGRLLVIGIGAVVVVLGGVGWYFLRQAQFDRRARRSRESAQAALAAGDYDSALTGMGQYLKRFGEAKATRDDYLLLARANRSVDNADSKHRRAAITALRKALELDPSCREAQDELLDLYMKTGLGTEALDLVGRMLSESPDELGLLRIQADLLEAMRQVAKALDVAQKVSGSPRAEFDDFLRTLRLMALSDTPASAVDAWLAAFATAHPGDPRANLLRAVALLRRNEPAKTKETLDRAFAACFSNDDPAFLALLAQLLDEAGRYDDALRVYQRLDGTTDPGLRREILRRLWFGGRIQEVAAHAERWDADRKTADPEILALHAAVLAGTDRRDDAAAIQRELANRKDRVAKAWSDFLAYVLTDAPGDLQKAAADMTEAVNAVPNNALLLTALGDVKARQGEADAALRAWTAAASTARTWAAPLARMARHYRATRQRDRARAAAQFAVARSPGNREALAVWSDVRLDDARTMAPEEAAATLKVLQTLESGIPEAAETLLPLRVALLIRSDKGKAEEVLRAVVESGATASGPPGETTLLRLADAAADAGIAMDARLLDLSQKLHGVTPRLALARAFAKARADGADAGVKTFDDLRAAAGGAAADLDWAMARTGFLGALGHPGALAAWKQLADAQPAALPVQLAALASTAFWTDREAVARVIERVRGLTGDNGITWRVARARLLMTAPSAPQGDLAEAATMLQHVVRDAPDDVSVRLLFAQALEKLGNSKGAEDELQAALEKAPDDPSIALEMARLAQKRGDMDAARQKLDLVANSKAAAPAQIERTAWMLAAQGDVQRSADILDQLTKTSAGSRDDALLLAQLYARMGRTDEAIRLCEGLLDRPTAAVIEVTAGLLAGVGRSADAEKQLARLDAMQLRPGDRELVRGRFAARFGPAGAALAWCRKAVEAAPERADAWTTLVKFAVRAGDKKTLASALDDPRAAAVEPVSFLSGIRPVCESAIEDAGLGRVLLAAMESAPDRPCLTQALDVTTRDWREPTKRAQTARKVREIAEANPRVLALQLLAADLCAQAGEMRAACEVSLRTAGAFPSSADAARQSAEMLARSARWEEALVASRAWRDRVGREDVSPDLSAAGALLRLDRPADAAAGLEARVASAMTRPAENEPLLLMYIVALSRSGRADRAAEVLGALAAKSDRWRMLPLSVGADWMKDAAESAAWLNLCSRVVPESDVRARLQLAQAWGAAWEKFGAPELLAGARRILDAAAASKDVPAEATYMEGALAQQAGDLAAARRAYEAVLAKNPGHLVARNNLAMVLADSQLWSDAVEQALRITVAAPRSAEFLDTLAYAYRKGRKFDEAKARLEEAVRLEPENPTWRVSLAETCFEAGDAKGTAAALADVDRMEAAGAKIPAALRGRVEKIRPKR